MTDPFSSLTRKSRKESVDYPGFRTATSGMAAPGPPGTYLEEWKASDPGQLDGFSWQDTLSEGHAWPPVKGVDMKDVGGPFWTSRLFVARSPKGKPEKDLDFLPFANISSANWRVANWGTSGNHLEGRILPKSVPTSKVSSDWPPVVASSPEMLFALGGTAIARCKPTNSVADLSVAIAELYREGLPKAPGVSTWQSRTNLARGAGEEYLNAQFGWLPLVNDVRDLARAIKHGDEIWAQYERDAGRVVRRSYRFPEITSVEEVSVQSPASCSPTGTSNLYAVPPTSGSSLRRIRHTFIQRWFDGAFTYHIPKREEGTPFGKFSEQAAKARLLYGLTLDPEVLWNLTPWSWAADWFVNGGDVISNLTDMATDGLVMRYGYMMEHSIVADEYTWRSNVRATRGHHPSTSSFCLVRETKQRVKASPYGFGVTWESFSPKQLAILAALGISRT